MEYRDERTVKELLDRYFEGATTLEEENTLRRLFAATDSVPADLRYAQAMFGTMGMMAAEECPQLIARKSTKRIRLGAYRRIALWAATSAAVVAVVAGVVVLTHEPTVYCYVNGEPITNRAEALRYTAQVFSTISESVDEPVRRLSTLEELNESLQALEYLSILNTK